MDNELQEECEFIDELLDKAHAVTNWEETHRKSSVYGSYNNIYKVFYEGTCCKCKKQISYTTYELCMLSYEETDFLNLKENPSFKKTNVIPIKSK